MSGNRLPCTISVQPWFKDHYVGQTIVFPAVETMLFLAAECVAAHPETDIRIMEDVRFGRFLEIPPAAATVAVLVECAATDGRIQAKLLSRMQFKAMARSKEHGEIFFSSQGKTDDPPLPNIDPLPPADPIAEVDTAHLYRELVPFGPCYHTLQESLFLTEIEAWGKLKAPDFPCIYPVQDIIGSPFPLDGALHAACVLGRQSVQFVPFPVGFSRRTVSRPTLPGGSYLTRVILTARTRDELVFDLIIFNDDGLVYETVTGLRMRDVSRAMKK
ncbi:MAG: hypothetical protein VR65_16775 [Desulfobulbaceae bacterium BRH_c16a]|nr:MAG: hypothetical protein VR65_16775 [Desulfobulbaceae bacterium BRH_c16a]